MVSGSRRHFYSYDLEKHKLVRIGGERVTMQEDSGKRVKHTFVSKKGAYIGVILEESE